ncbi:hypothetical protein RJ035_002198 [Blastomyces gilchristii]
MTKEATPPPPATTTRQPPSLPNSPIAKRPKTTATMAPAAESAAAPAPAPSESTTTPSATPAVTSLSQSKAPPLLVKKLVPTARVPTRGSAFAAGYDLYCAKPIVIPAKGKDLVNTGLAIAVPEGTFNEGDRIAQLVLERGRNMAGADISIFQIYTPEVVEVEQLEESVRGAGGFGSTG